MARVDRGEAVPGIRAAVGALVRAWGLAGGADVDTDLGERAARLARRAGRGVPACLARHRREAVPSVRAAELARVADAAAAAAAEVCTDGGELEVEDAGVALGPDPDGTDRREGACGRADALILRGALDRRLAGARGPLVREGGERQRNLLQV